MAGKKYFIFFSNLANPLRINIITVLKEKEMSVTEIVNKLEIEQSKISHALSKLKECNIVEVSSKGKKRIYTLNKKTILPILHLIDKHSRLNCRGKCKFCIGQ